MSASNPSAASRGPIGMPGRAAEKQTVPDTVPTDPAADDDISTAGEEDPGAAFDELTPDELSAPPPRRPLV